MLVVLKCPFFARFITVSDTDTDESVKDIFWTLILVKGTAPDVNGYYGLLTALDALLVVRYLRDFHFLRPIQQRLINLAATGSHYTQNPGF